MSKLALVCLTALITLSAAALLAQDQPAGAGADVAARADSLIGRFLADDGPPALSVALVRGGVVTKLVLEQAGGRYQGARNK